MTRGCGWEGLLSALRNSRLAASASRNADSRKSIVAPVEIDGPCRGNTNCPLRECTFHRYANLVGRLEVTAQPLIQFGTITLNPTPDRRVICLQSALGKQLLHIGKRQRVPKIPAHGAKNQLWRRLPPLEDRRSGCVLHGLLRLPIALRSRLQHIRLRIPRSSGQGGSSDRCRRYSYGHTR